MISTNEKQHQQLFKRTINISAKTCISLTASSSVLMILVKDIVEDNLVDAHSVTKVFLIHRQ